MKSKPLSTAVVAKHTDAAATSSGFLVPQSWRRCHLLG